MSVVHINNNLKQTLEMMRICVYVCVCVEREREREGREEREREYAKVKKEYVMP